MNNFLKDNIGLVLIALAGLGLTVEAASHQHWELAAVFGVCVGLLCIALYQNSRNR